LAPTHSSLKWCRPDVSEQTVVTDDCNTTTVQSNQEAGMLVIRKGRYPIDVADTLGSGGDGFSEFIPNDAFASDEKTFTVITGINGMFNILMSHNFNTLFIDPWPFRSLDYCTEF
jgi:hypothetical protein